MVNKSIWDNVLSNVKKELCLLSYDTWFKDLVFIDVKNNAARIIVPKLLYKNHIERNYKTLIINNFNLYLDTPIDNIIFILEENYNEEIEKEKNYNNIQIQDDKKITNLNTNLIKNYTFSNFIVGESNKFAQAAALAVAENPGTIYNPLFLYGNSGLGKTHLMHAIGNYINDNTLKRVLYVTSDQFISDFIGLSRRNNDDNNLDYMEYFKEKYRNVDVLLIDDIQFLGTATKTQQEFFHTFNSLYNDSKQIIITSDRSPDDLNILEDRLRTRFNSGLTVNIYPPDFDLRFAIIKKKIKGQQLNKEINDEIISYMASNLDNDVRQLEGAVIRLIAYSTMMGKVNITLEIAIEALRDIINKRNINDSNNIKKIQKVVANFYKINFEDLKSKKRTNEIAIPRQVAMYLCRNLTDESFPKIGDAFGGKDHTTVMHSCNKIENEIKKNSELKKSIDYLKKQLTS